MRVLVGALACCLVGLALACATAGRPTGSEGGAGAPRAGAGTAPAAGPASGPTEQAGEWERVVAAARQEGKVTVGMPLGEAYRRALPAFQQAYPGIEPDLIGIHTRDFLPRIRTERDSGQYLWDVFVGGPSDVMYEFAQVGFWDPLKPDVRVDVREDGKWRQGFDAGFSDSVKQFTYNFVHKLHTGSIFVNRDFIAEADLGSVDQLWDPRWKGRIAWFDPRGPGSGSLSAAMVMYHYGEDAARRLFLDQDVIISSDQRQVLEWIVRGRYPIVGGLVDRELKVMFQEQGLGLNVRPIVIPGRVSVIPGSNSVAVVNRPPHPNARQVFLNWLLSREGQTIVARETDENSRRVDVPVVDPGAVPPDGGSFLNAQSEEFQPVYEQMYRLTRAILK
jgi:iron(III) transport system substrate-binding protein